MSIRTPGKALAGQQGGPPSEPPYPWRVFVGMLLAILIGGAILALALGVNPLTFQKFGAEPEATPAALAAPVVAANTPAAGATVAPVGAVAPAVAPTAIPTPVAAAPLQFRRRRRPLLLSPELKSPKQRPPQRRQSRRFKLLNLLPYRTNRPNPLRYRRPCPPS